MPSIRELFMWFMSGEGRLVAAASLFGVMYLVKLHPWVEAKVLTTPRRRQLALGFLATAPAVWLLADGSVPLQEAAVTAIEAFLGAMGIHVGIKTLKGTPVGLPGDSMPPVIESIAKAAAKQQRLERLGINGAPPAPPDT